MPTSSEAARLILLLSDVRDTQRQRAERKLLELGREAVEHLLPLLDSRDWFLRAKAAELLGRIGDDCAVPRLVATFNGDDLTDVFIAKALRDITGIDFGTNLGDWRRWLRQAN